MAKMGRPRKEINQREFEAMCAIQCTEAEICSVLGVSEKTLNGWCRRTYKETFSQVFKEKRQVGYVSLRRTQWDLAKKNVSMAIFLGKNYLGQSDRVQIDQSAVLNKLDSVLDGIKDDADNQVTDATE